jgi:hypothetical protein
MRFQWRIDFYWWYLSIYIYSFRVIWRDTDLKRSSFVHAIFESAWYTHVTTQWRYKHSVKVVPGQHDVIKMARFGVRVDCKQPRCQEPGRFGSSVTLTVLPFAGSAAIRGEVGLIKHVPFATTGGDECTSPVTSISTTLHLYFLFLSTLNIASTADVLATACRSHDLSFSSFATQNTTLREVYERPNEFHVPVILSPFWTNNTLVMFGRTEMKERFPKVRGKLFHRYNVGPCSSKGPITTMCHHIVNWSTNQSI